MLDWRPFVLIVVPTVALGVMAGRFPRLLVLVVLPVPIAWIWYRRNYGGPDDDITGLAAIFFALLDMAISPPPPPLRGWPSERGGGLAQIRLPRANSTVAHRADHGPDPCLGLRLTGTERM